MTLVLLPPWRVASRSPAVRLAVVLVLSCPLYVAWLGKADAAPTRLRVVGFLLGVALAMVWDDRCAVVTAPTPVGLPAVRRGRAAVVLALLASAWVLSAFAAGGGDHLAAITLQSAAVAALLTAVVGWLARDRAGEPVAALPVPVLLGLLLLFQLLPARAALLRATPGTPEWGAERTRWLVLLAVSAMVVAGLDREGGLVRRRPRRGP